MSSEVLLFNNVTSGGGDTPTPTAVLTTDSLYTHLDANDIDEKNWHDRMGHYNFVSDASLGLTTSAYNLTCGKMLNKYKMAYCNSFKFGAFPFTLEFTVNITATQNYGILFSAKTNTAFKLGYRNNGYFGIYSTNMSPDALNEAIPSSEIIDGNLHVITFVFASSSKLITYLDGVKKATIASTAFSNNMLTAGGYKLGSYSSETTGSLLTGHLYSFRFYKKELSEYEIRCNCLYEASQGRTDVASDTEQSYFLEKWN